MKIAGQTAQVSSLFDSTRDYCRKYLTEENADFSVTVTREDLTFEQEALRQEALAEGIKVRTFTDPFLERTAIQRKFAEFLFDKDVLMTHGSTVAVDGKAYLFTAKCGTGKSTHTRIWCRMFKERCIVVNDDKPLLLVTDDAVMVCGTPWDGKHRRSTNTMVPLKGLVILERGEDNFIEPINGAAALPLLLQQSYRPSTPAALTKMLNLLQRAIEKTHLYRLKCTISPRAVIEAYRGMNRKDQ